MKLQIAIDMGNAETALSMVKEIHDVIDIVEIGTPMIVREGMLAVRLIKASYPNVVVLADAKIVDGGAIESEDAFEAGADLVTVLAVANDETIQAVVNTARKHGKQVVADMICVNDVEKRAIELDDIGLDYFCVHTSVDVRNTAKTPKTPFDELTKIMKVLKNAKAAVAGGVNMKTIPLVKKIGPEIVVIGSALARAANLRAAVVDMEEAIKN
jgi:3-hexulose-6-phosphate synthase